MHRNQEELCLFETKDSVTSISTMDYVPQPVIEKSHFIRNRIFVGNFPDSATHKDISNAFCVFGKIIETNIIEAPNSLTRYGFVTFQDIAAADEIIRLSSLGREFRVKGKVATINRALFKPKKHSLNNKTSLNVTNSQSVMVVDGRPVVTMFANGMAYFRPVGQDKVISSARLIPSQANAVFQKSIRATFPSFSPRFHIANHCQIPPTLPSNNLGIHFSSTIPQKNYSSGMPLPPIPSCFHNLHSSFVPARTHHQSRFFITSL